MSRKNAVKVKTLIAESSCYHFKSATDDTSYVIASKHGLCHEAAECIPYNNGDADCCKFCPVVLDLTSVVLHNKSGARLTPSRVYSFPKNDIAIIQVEESSTTPLKIGSLKEGEGNYIAIGYKGNSTSVSRLLINNPELDKDECYFNIESITTTELVEKSEDLIGMSGALVIKRGSSDIPIAYSVITTNEEANDILGEQLQLINFGEMHEFFGSVVFSQQPCKINIDTSFKDHFTTTSTIYVNDKLQISILLPIKIGFPYFNLNPIARSLISEFEAILGKKAENKSMLAISALRVLEQKKELQPVYKLLASRIVESVMNAPHIYSTYIDHSHYHHVHLLNESSSGVEFIVSSYGGEADLSEQLDYTLSQMLHHLNHYAFDASLISERAFLDVKYTAEECEALYEVLFGNNDDFIRNLSIMYCMDLQYYGISKKKSLEEQIELIVDEAINKINEYTIDQIQNELNVNLYVLPMNKSNELTELVEGLIK